MDDLSLKVMNHALYFQFNRQFIFYCNKDILRSQPYPNAVVTNINGIVSHIIDLDGNIVARNSSAVIFGQPGGGFVDVVDTGHGTFFVTSTLNTEIAEVDVDLAVVRRFPTGASGGGLQILGAALTTDATRLYVADANGQSGDGFIRIYDADLGLQIGDQLQLPRHCRNLTPLEKGDSPLN